MPPEIRTPAPRLPRRRTSSRGTLLTLATILAAAASPPTVTASPPATSPPAITASPPAITASPPATSPPAITASPPTVTASPPTATAPAPTVTGSPGAGPAWRRPVPGAVSRAFAYSPDAPFTAGRHRGVDLSARPGAVVRAACSGRVVFAGRDVVTLRCGPWRVTHLPVAATIAAGRRIAAGARIGTLLAGGDHAGLHLGVRREGDPFGYVDPLPFLHAAPRAVPVGREGPRGDPRPTPPARAPAAEGPRPAPPAGAPATPQARAPFSRPVPAPPSSPAAAERVRVSADRRIAPWPVWLGLGLVLCGAIGGGIRVRVATRRRLAEAVAS